MRRRVVISGFVVIVVAGVLAFALSGPRKGSVEWHKKEYRANWKGAPLISLLRAAWSEVFPQETSGVDHGRALVDLGYWDRRVFVISNRVATGVMMQLDIQAKKIVPEGELYAVFVETSPKNTVIVFAMPRYMPEFEKAVRKLDIP